MLSHLQGALAADRGHHLRGQDGFEYWCRVGCAPNEGESLRVVLGDDIDEWQQSDKWE